MIRASKAIPQAAPARKRGLIRGIKKKLQGHRITLGRLSYTGMIMAIYLAGRRIPLYQVDREAYQSLFPETENLLLQTIGAGQEQTSIFALGLSALMIAWLLEFFLDPLLREVVGEERSEKIIRWFTALATAAIAIAQAYFQLRDLPFAKTGVLLAVQQTIVMLEMVAGVMLILYLSRRNQRYGIGAQTALILVNVIEGILRLLAGVPMEKLLLPLIFGAALIPLAIVMEYTEKRITLLRISVHNIYADKNYLAVKLNPAGIMPVMFASSIFYLVRLLVRLQAGEGQAGALELDQPVGIAVYLVILILLTVGISFLMVSPGETADRLLKSGDILAGIPAGKRTARYLRGVVLRFSLFSAFVLAVCMGIPLFLQARGLVDGSLAMLPASLMILTGLCCSFFRDYQSVRTYDAYKTFL